MQRHWRIVMSEPQSPGAGDDSPMSEQTRATIDGTDNSAVIGCAKARNNGRYNGNGRDWETPPEVFGPLDAEFDFTLDPCCTVKTAKCLRYFTEEQNGLEQDWRH